MLSTIPRREPPKGHFSRRREGLTGWSDSMMWRSGRGKKIRKRKEGLKEGNHVKSEDPKRT